MILLGTGYIDLVIIQRNEADMEICLKIGRETAMASEIALKELERQAKFNQKHVSR